MSYSTFSEIITFRVKQGTVSVILLFRPLSEQQWERYKLRFSYFLKRDNSVNFLKSWMGWFILV